MFRDGLLGRDDASFMKKKTNSFIGSKNIYDYNFNEIQLRQTTLKSIRSIKMSYYALGNKHE